MIDQKIQKNNYFEYRNVDAKAYENAQLPIWIKNEMEHNKLKILDYGCGFGQNIAALLNEDYSNVYGVDIEKQAISSCLDKGMNVKELDLENLKNPFELKFDVIILSHIVEHIPKSEIINTISFIKKEFLANGGKLLIAVPNAQSNTDSYWAYEDWTHTTLFTSGSLYYVLKSAGFSNVEFIDIDCALSSNGIIKIIRMFLLKLYKMNKNFWNKVTCSSYHKPSPDIFSFEIKCKAY
jgi:2-polyprenyl-3-methyl-5-hydroxy-6-metoxy-1,4-benzoquinol methylase